MMKRMIVGILMILFLTMPTVVQAQSIAEVRLCEYDGRRQAELWLKDSLVFRLVLAEDIPVKTEEAGANTIWISPKISGGMLSLFVK